MAEQADSAFKNALESNQRWAAETAKADPEFFPKCAAGQSPKVLWIGCCDSRVPETTVLGLKPGDLFVHRNIATIVNPTDLSVLSAVELAVMALKVQHIVVCGHTSCAGVEATLGSGKLGGPLDIWLQPLRALREKHSEELSKLEGMEKAKFLCKLNVQHGVNVLKRIPTVIDAMRERGMEVNGAIYNLASGIVEEVETAEHEDAGKTREAAYERK